MLKQRVLTALVMLAVFIAALAAPTPVPFLALTLLLIAAAGWEWSRLVGWPGWRAWASGALCAGLGLAAWWVGWPAPIPTVEAILSSGYDPNLLWIDGWVSIAGLFWIPCGLGMLWLGVAGWSEQPRWLNWIIGLGALVVAWLALAQAYAQGINFLLSVLALVWVADIAAYFCGRALGGKLTGGRKLAPTISPGKTWEGAAGGFIGVLLTGVCWAAVDHWRGTHSSLYSLLWRGGPVWFFVAALALLTAMSVVGDLSESLVKRAAGVKDSSALLPGHGGVLDRIDALLPALPLAIVITKLVIPMPMLRLA